MAQNGRLGNYQLIKKLATGGMAEVWLAKQVGIEGFNRHVVIKRILPHLAEDPEFVQMFLNEAKIAAKFSHPNIAQIYDFGEKDGTYFIAMEFIHGEDLGRLMRKAWSTGQWIARPLAIRIIASACEGLHYAHTRKGDDGLPLKVVHRDISPQNLLISFDGSVKVVDFGIAKAADQVSLTKSGAIKGKFAYMAPEQAAGKPLDSRTDVFALGLVLYELLTGVRPLKRDSELATLQAALECNIEPPSVVAEVPSELDDVVMRALTKAADDRYKDARTFQMALEEFLIGQRMVATSVQISELMETLFAERRAEENRLGAPNPQGAESMSAAPVVPEPPGWEQRQKSRSVEPVKQAFHEPLTDQGLPGDVDAPGGKAFSDWEAPPAVLPSRKYNQSGQPPRSETSDNVTRAKPPTREVESVDPSVVEPKPKGAPKRTKVAVEVEDEDEPTGDDTGNDDPDSTRMPQPSEPRRSSVIAKPRRTATGMGSGNTMPEAPPRRSRPEMAAVEARRSNPPRRTGVNGARLATPPPQAASVASEPKLAVPPRKGSTLLLALLGVALVGAGALVFKSMFSGGPSTGDERPAVYLTVNTSPRTRVTVVHKGGEVQDLGETPLKHVSGALVGDRLLLSNDDVGIRYEDTSSLEYGQPNEEKKIEKTFTEGELVVKVSPPVKGLVVWRNNQRLGNPGLAIRLYEGKHELELRGDALRAPVSFQATITPHNKTVQPVDVSNVVDQ